MVIGHRSRLAVAALLGAARIVALAAVGVVVVAPSRFLVLLCGRTRVRAPEQQALCDEQCLRERADLLTRAVARAERAAEVRERQ